MKIVHTITFDSRRLAQRFRQVGLESAEFTEPFPYYEIRVSEDGAQWATAAEVLRETRGDVTDHAETTFTEPERNGAAVLVVSTLKQYGYPQPEQMFGFLQATYDLSGFCGRCKANRKQVAPFRLATRPKFSVGRAFLQLNWVLDELFVSSETWATVFKPHGVASWPVLAHKTGKEIDGVVQLKIDKCSAIRGNDGLPLKNCPKCGRPIYALTGRGLLPAPKTVPSPLFRSTERFTDAGLNLLFVTSDLYVAIKRVGLKGAQFAPCRDRTPLTDASAHI